jgi:hypothetical protein
MSLERERRGGVLPQDLKGGARRSSSPDSLVPRDHFAQTVVASQAARRDRRGTPTWLQARSVGVRFHLGLAASVLHWPANELADARPDLAAAWAAPPPTLSSTSRPRRRRRRH